MCFNSIRRCLFHSYLAMQSYVRHCTSDKLWYFLDWHLVGYLWSCNVWLLLMLLLRLQCVSHFITDFLMWLLVAGCRHCTAHVAAPHSHRFWCITMRIHTYLYTGKSQSPLSLFLLQFCHSNDFQCARRFSLCFFCPVFLPHISPFGLALCSAAVSFCFCDLYAVHIMQLAIYAA